MAVHDRSPPQGWADPEFDDGSWSVGEGGFGTERTPGARVRTIWDTPQIWLRRTFSLTEEELDALSGRNLNLRVHHDEDAEIYLNGVEIADLPGYATGYRLVPMDPDAVALLRPGVNLLAAHVRQTTGGQYFDAGLVEWVEPPGD